jgi:hypothetical protein
MPLIYPLVTRHLMERCSSIDIRQSLIKMCCFLFLSFFTTIVINILIPILIFKTSPSSISLLTSNHIYFPSDLISLQYHHELQMNFQGKKRTYTKDHSKEKNISYGKIFKKI